MYDHIKFDTGEFKCVNHWMKMKENKKQKTKSKQYLKMLSAKRRANEEEE